MTIQGGRLKWRPKQEKKEKRKSYHLCRFDSFRPFLSLSLSVCVSLFCSSLLATMLRSLYSTIILAYLFIGIASTAHLSQDQRLLRMKKRDEYETPDPVIATCSEAPYMQGKPFNKGDRYQLLPIGGTSPGGEWNTYQNSIDSSKVAFKVLVSDATSSAISMTLINLKTNAVGAPSTDANQIGLYRFRLFDRKGQSHDTFYWLSGHDKCHATIVNPPNIDEKFVINIVRLNTLPSS